MENMQKSEFGEAIENAEGIDILECSEHDIFNVMQEALLKAFDRETTFDMRMPQQMMLMEKDCSVGVMNEKDHKLYPFVKLVIGIRDGYYDDVEKVFKMYKKRDAEFEVLFTPFTCALEKHGQKTGGIYSGSDKNLTAAWRKIMMGVFPKWEEKFRVYLQTIKESKISEITNSSENEIKRLQREIRFGCHKAEEEYSEELKSVGLEK